MAGDRAVLRHCELFVVIETLKRLLRGRVFDFTYMLWGKQAQTITNNVLAEGMECRDSILVESRKIRDDYKLFLVFVTNDEDDLLVSLSEYDSDLDVEIGDDDRILITNDIGDWYEIKIHEER